MQDSLISRKALMKEIHNFVEEHRNDDEVSWTGLDWLLKEDDVVAMISNVPTAYDLDKVVERLEERKADREKEYKTASLQDGSYMLSMVFRESAKAYERGIEILKGGGVDEQQL